METIRQIKPKDMIIGEVMGKGLMVGVEPVKERDTKIPADKETAIIRSSLRD